MKQIYFWLFLLTAGMVQTQTVQYQYDETGNRTGRSTATPATVQQISRTAHTEQGTCCSSPCNHYIEKTANGDTIYEWIPKAIELLPPGFHASVHTDGILPDDQLPDIQPAAAPLPVSSAVDTKKKVGEIPLLSSVENGSLAYQVPIEVYPGRHGFQPEISLTYNSLGGNGVAGYGWNIGGVSSIVPVHSNYYYNGTDAKPETMGAHADYALDGVSLRRIGTGKYQTEQGHIEATIQDTGNKYYFNVVFPDGRKALYGYTNHTTPQVSYPLKEVTDPTGNFIRYTYLTYENTPYVSEITYGCNGTTIGKIKFTYTIRADVPEGYRAGNKIRMNRLLTQIQVYYQTTLLRTYTLTHRYTDVNLLKTIGCKAGSSELNPLTFHYPAETTTPASFTTSTTTLLTYFSSSATKVLFQRYKENNSSATEGLIAWPDFPTYGIVRYNTNQDCQYGSLYPADQELLVYKQITPGAYSPVKITAKANFAGILAMDYLGNGKDAIFTLNYKYNASASQLTITNHTTASGTPVTITKNLKGYIKEGSYYSPAPRIFLTGDFTGDGRPKLVSVSGYKTPKKQTQSTLGSWLTMMDIASNQTLVDLNVFQFDINEDLLFTLDFNGDGRTDLCHIRAGGTDVYSYIGNRFVKIASTSALTINDTRATQGKTLVVGDLNGDGKADLMTSPAPNMFTWEKVHYSTCQGGCKGRKISVSADGDIETWEHNGKYCYLYTNEQKVYKPGARTWKVFFSKGTAFDNTSIEFLPRELEHTYLLYDVNGDRLPDMVIKSDDRIQAYLNLGGYLSRAVIASRAVDRRTVLLPGIVTTSWSAEKRLANLLAIHNATVTTLKLNRNDGERKKISSAVNSLGVTQKVYYKPMSDASVYKTEGTLSSSRHYPLILNESLVSSIETWVNNLKTEDNAYQYRNSAYHPQGVGFCGFEKITITDRLRNRNTVLSYTFPKQGVISQIDSPESNVKLQYHHLTGTGKILTLNVTGKEITNKLTATSTRTTYRYDSYDNIAEEKVEYPGTSEKVTKIYTYNYTHSKREPAKQTVITEQNGTWTEETEISSVHLTTRQPQTILQSINGRKVSETHYKWTNGHLEETREKAFESPVTHITTYTRDSCGRIEKVKDPMGLTTTYEYDVSKGTLKKTSNHKQKDILYTYDELGRVEKVIYPDGNRDSTLLEWSTTPAGALYKITQKSTGEPDAVGFYDALNREIRTGTQRFDNSWIYTDYQYDNRGRLINESLPFKTSPTTNRITYTYDNYDRITQVTHPAGNTTRFIYDKLKTTTVENGISTIRTIDPAGRLVSVTDPGGTITYDYMAGGRSYRTFLPDGSIQVTPRDMYGRIQSEYDPSHGTTSYYYDSNGNLQKTVDAANNTTEYQYDGFNRPVTVRKGDMTITYEYQDELLVKKSTGQGNSIEYTYDTLNRLSKIRENGPDGKWLQQEITYTDGKPVTVTYSSRSGVITTIHNQYAYGHLTEQKLPVQPAFFKITAENTFGIPTGVTTGNINRTYGYTGYGVMNSRSAKNGSTTLQHFTYEVDALKGVMNSRKDQTRAKEERFTYDNLNRLTNFAGQGVTYDTKGNILSKNNAGNYLYTNPANPYSVTQLNQVKSSVPVRDQNVEYYSFKRPKTIRENGYTATFTYNADFDRVKMHLTKNGTKELTRYYLGNCYEIDENAAGQTKEKLYLGGTYYTAPAVYVRENSGIWQLYYICRDHLGSITHLINSNGSAVTQELSYDAWGTLRNPASQANYAPGSEPTLFLGRGYTGHEHLPWFGLVNMNARLYDPALGRFLAPDPYVQMPDFTQNYNRYSYCLNNPLMYVDEDGEIVWFIPVVAAIVGGTINLAANWDNIDGFWQGFTTFTVGAGAGFAVAATAGTAGPWIAAGIAAAGGALTGGNNSIVAQTGHNFSGMSNVNWQQVGVNSLAGGAAAFASSIGGHYASNILGSLNIYANGTKLGPVLNNALQQAMGGGATGYMGGFASGLILTGNVRDAHALGANGAKIGLATGFARGAATGYLYAQRNNLNPWTGKERYKAPTQTHHFATNKNSIFTPKMAQIANEFGLDLDGDWNKAGMPHRGRHPNAYHRWVLEIMEEIRNTPGMNRQQFIYEFNQQIKQPVLNNPQMLRKSFW